MDNALLNAVKNRRSFYTIGKEKVLSDEKIVELVHHAVQYAPSAFHSQSARVLVLLGKEHEKLWENTKDVLRELVPAKQFTSTEEKINSFKNGYGSILFFEDEETVKNLQQKFPLYQQNFPIWSLQSSGMLQYSIWMMLEDAGYGASLQHYNPLIDQKVKELWGIPETWMLHAEMPFGKPLAAPESKTFLPINERVKVFSQNV